MPCGSVSPEAMVRWSLAFYFSGVSTGMRHAPRVELSPGQREELGRWGASDGRPARQTVRAKIVLEAAEDHRNTEISARLGVHPETVSRWRGRFLVNGVEGLSREAPRAGSSVRTPRAHVERVLRTTLEEAAPGNRAWSTRSLARALNTNHMLVHRIWTAYGLSNPTSRGARPTHRTAAYVDLTGAFVTPAVGAIVFVVDRRAVRAVRRRVLPEIVPNVTGSPLFSGLSGARPELLGAIESIHRERSTSSSGRTAAAPLLVFLRGVERRVPRSARLDVILDRPLADLGDRVADWLEVHGRFHVYTTSTEDRWPAMVEGWLRRWERSPLHPESFTSVGPFMAALRPTNPAGRGIAPRFSWTPDGTLPRAIGS